MKGNLDLSAVSSEPFLQSQGIRVDHTEKPEAGMRVAGQSEVNVIGGE